MEVEVNAPRSDNDTLLTHPTNRELAAWLTGGLMLHVQKADGQVGLGKPWDLAWVSHPPKQEWFLDLEYWYLGQDHTAPIPLWDLALSRGPLMSPPSCKDAYLHSFSWHSGLLSCSPYT